MHRVFLSNGITLDYLPPCLYCSIMHIFACIVQLNSRFEFRFLCDESQTFILKVSLHSGSGRLCTEVNVTDTFEACVVAS